MAHVLITGASGLLGQALTRLLLDRDHSVSHLGRKENLQAKVKCYRWDIDSGYMDEKAFEGIDTVVHLAGAGVMDQRWTEARKQVVINSRVRSGKMLADAINKRSVQINTFVGASAIGYYGALSNDTIYTEDMPPANDFMAHVCSEWEKSYETIDPSCRKTIIRIGVVLSRDGGALVEMMKTAKPGVLSPLGSGKQYMPWIHIDDMTKLLYEAVTNSTYQGVYNGVAPQHVTNKEFTHELMHALGKKVWTPNVPAFVLKLMLGKMAVVVLEGSRVSADKLVNQGFRFKFTDIKSALKDLVAKA